MAHFAKINEKNTVEQVIVIDNNNIDHLEFPESEPVGQEFIKSIGLDGNWLQTSYNSKFRKHFAGTEYTYDKVKDVFVPPQPYPSWILDADTLLWTPPAKYPSDGKLYRWDETIKNWIE